MPVILTGRRPGPTPPTPCAATPAGGLRVAFVNNMPEGAFEETEQQFRRLLEQAAGPSTVRLSRHLLPGLGRGPAAAGDYAGLEELYADAPDALIVTGTEPIRADLRDESYWDSLGQLLDWAQSQVASALLSCLASHLALLRFDGIARRRLPVKCSGVYPQVLRPSHPLVQDLAAVQFPHSRLNDVATDELTGHGYSVAVESAEGGWTVATQERDQCLFVLFQGHPEYAAGTLLREYRRDVRRWLEGQRPDYPCLPVGYLDDYGTGLLEEFRGRARVARRAGAGSDVMASFPVEQVAARVAVDWQSASATLMANWLAEVGRRREPALGPVRPAQVGNGGRRDLARA